MLIFKRVFALNFCIAFEIKIHFGLPLLLIFIPFFSYFILQLQNKKPAVFRDGSYFVLAPFQTPCRNTVSME
jgi:hypothetical protein